LGKAWISAQAQVRLGQPNTKRLANQIINHPSHLLTSSDTFIFIIIGGLPVDFTGPCKAIFKSCKTVFPEKN
jgi:hypothetical protein